MSLGNPNLFTDTFLVNDTGANGIKQGKSNHRRKRQESKAPQQRKWCFKEKGSPKICG